MACRRKIILRQGSFVLKRAPDFFGIGSGGGGAFCAAYARLCSLLRPPPQGRASNPGAVCLAHARPCGLHGLRAPLRFARLTRAPSVSDRL
ncbi:MAG: hypothetical protein DU429_06270 [Candidatus Tokpelaia sp.]|nr:MAG: hypothetical protein DU430_01650 [Candidatus Tokpelaia sp.]KAA6206326.1 MAG: hypothetical protein DU429_06270 [Candidatus Tokpelaia sp.]